MFIRHHYYKKYDYNFSHEDIFSIITTVFHYYITYYIFTDLFVFEQEEL